MHYYGHIDVGNFVYLQGFIPYVYDVLRRGSQSNQDSDENDDQSEHDTNNCSNDDILLVRTRFLRLAGTSSLQIK